MIMIPTLDFHSIDCCVAILSSFSNSIKQNKMSTVTAKSYTLRTESGQWLGQIILTSDGCFASVTDYGNFSYAWRSTGHEDFREFLCRLNVDYFGTKIYTGFSYYAYGKKYEAACKRYAEKILPPLQKILREEIESENHNSDQNAKASAATEFLNNDFER